MIIGLYPGKFKPPHKGHYFVAEQALKAVDKLIIIISSRIVDGITPEQSKRIWEEFLKDKNNWEVIISPHPTPVTTVYQIVKDSSNNYLVIFGKEDGERYERIKKYPNVEIVNGGSLEGYHASLLRKSINEKETKKNLF